MSLKHGDIKYNYYLVERNEGFLNKGVLLQHVIIKH